jgi:hypothetical protein
MEVMEYLVERFTVLGKYGYTKQEIDEQADGYLQQLMENYSLEDVPVDIRGFIDVRLNDIIPDIIRDNVFRYPLQDDSGELIAILETKRTRGEVLAEVAAFRQEEGVEFDKFMEEAGIVVMGDFETKIDWM